MDLRYAFPPVLLATLLFVVPTFGSEIETASDKPRQPPASRLMEARCTSCHGLTLALSFSREMLDDGGKDALDAFLAKHHAPDAAARAAIVDFLAARRENSGS